MMKGDLSIRGLTSDEAKKLLNKYGPNRIVKKKTRSPLEIFLSQFTSPIILLLIVAALVSLYINYTNGEGYFDSILILIIVFASGIAGFIQDYKAERAVEALQRLATPTAHVIRDGREISIPATDIVPGDVVVLRGGDVVPADGTVLDGRIDVDESPLTGESHSVHKRKDEKVFMGCSVYSGFALIEVHATGMNTELGKIAAKMVEIKEEETPFQKQMRQFGNKLVMLTLFVIMITFFVSITKFSIVESLMIAISLAVAAVPEDLPAVITIALSLGARRMAKRNALVRKLSITESIGTVDVICTDKTGTLTRGRMTVRDLWFPGTGSKGLSELRSLAIKTMFYCNDAKPLGDGSWVGDETDQALKEYSSKYITEEGERLDEIPFTSEKKMMAVLHKFDDERFVFVKGAPEVLLGMSKYIVSNGRKRRLTAKMKQEILEKNDELSENGYRILGLAYREVGSRVRSVQKVLDTGLVFIGLVILSDPPRPEVRSAVEDCYSAGIRIIMITGDNPRTALAVAREVGIRSEGVITGDDLDRMSDEQLKDSLDAGVNVFARTSPFHKLRILKVLQREGHIVAMTGDGVNDALAIKKADVGIAMGIKGTEVAKEASHIILLDDNFYTIKEAIKEGRTIFDNIRKFVDYLLTCNVAEVLVVLLATLFLPYISLYPVQILWINLITDGLPALALSLDPPRPDVMKRPPRPKDEGIVNRKLALMIGGIGVEKAIIIILTFLVVLPLGVDRARSTLFTAFILYEFVRIGVIRYNEKLASLRDWFANRYLVISLILSIVLQFVILYSPLNEYFKVVPLGWFEWEVLMIGTILGLVLGILIAKVVDMITHESY